MTVPLVPPLQSHWQSTVTLVAAAASGDRIYGITSDGRATALRLETGELLWSTDPVYLPQFAAAGRQLYLYRRGQGLAALTDQESTYSEQLLLAISPCDESTPLTAPVPDGDLIYFANGSNLMAVAAAGGQRLSFPIPGELPWSIRLWKPRLLAVVDGLGRPALYRAQSDRFTQSWIRAIPDPGTDAAPRPCLLVNDRLYTAGNSGAFAFDAIGQMLWQAPGPRPSALAASGDAVYAARGGQVWALDAATGTVRWSRCWVHPAIPSAQTALAAVEGYLYLGNLLGADPSRADLIALRSAEGMLVWQPPATEAGLPLPAGARQLIAWGAAGPAASHALLPLQPAVYGNDLSHQPRPLRGPESGFAECEVLLRLKTRATVTIRPWREEDGPGAPIVEATSLPPGAHRFPWDARRPRGFGDAPRLGRLVMAVAEADTGLQYTVSAPLPVNTMPDILDHWAAVAIEAMLYHQFVSGYPDLTFKPENLVTRAESATIIAKTLGLSSPSPGFQSRLTDIGGHWAEPYIKALEERGIVSGFREPDGSYTFRPEARMTRAEEARILGRAYGIAPAPSGFRTRFTDIAGHWAEADIKALEAGGYTTGYEEPDGTYTYRPGQWLTRAELCALVVRIRSLSGPQRGGDGA